MHENSSVHHACKHMCGILQRFVTRSLLSREPSEVRVHNSIMLSSNYSVCERAEARVSARMQMEQWPVEYKKNRFDEFLTASSQALEIQSPRCNATETVFGASIDENQLPLRSAEYRTFLYQDNKVRTVDGLYSAVI
jgi:hypothetical protein